MSYRVDGVHYETWAEYRRAVRRRETRIAREEMVRLLAEAGRLETRIADRKRRLEAPGADLEREMHELALLQADVAELRRLQDRIVTCRERSESRIDELLRKARIATGREDASGDDAEDTGLEEAGRALVEAARRIEGGVVEAERTARRAGELVEGRQDVEDERSRRVEGEGLRRHREDASRAEDAIRRAGQELSTLAGDLEDLDLGDRREETSERLAEATRLSLEGQVQAALGMAAGVAASVRSLARSARARRAELAARRDATADRVARLRRELVEPELEKWFQGEVQAALRALDGVTRKLATSFRRHRAIEVDAGRLEEEISRVEEATGRMTASLATVRELATARKERAKLLLAELARIYGPLTKFEQRFADPGDRKSTLVVECDFGGARVDVHLGLEGGYTIDGYRHDSNATCAARAGSLLEALTRRSVVQERKVETTNRDRPTSGPVEPVRSGWAGLATLLEEPNRS